MLIVNLIASPFVGGPERQMLGLARNLPAEYRTVFLALANRGKSLPLVQEARRSSFEAILLEHDAPQYRATIREVAAQLRRLGADVLCCHGYKPDILGWRAARLARVPVIAVAHGWTAATFKVRVNEALDRLVLRWMDRVVCVSEGQAVKVRQAGVPDRQITVIRNAIGPEAFASGDEKYRRQLRSFLPADCRYVIGAAGRLSPEKGFDQLVKAAEVVCKRRRDVGFVLFGDGPLRQALERQITAAGLGERFVLAGFHTDLGGFIPFWDVAVLPSFTEGLPVVILEALAVGVPVVATAVGGTPEVVVDRVNGFLVPPREPAALAERILDVLHDDAGRRAMGKHGREWVREHFTFEAQSDHYQRLFRQLTNAHEPRPSGSGGRFRFLTGAAR